LRLRQKQHSSVVSHLTPTAGPSEKAVKFVHRPQSLNVVLPNVIEGMENDDEEEHTDSEDVAL
jgi:hypothetical protein